MLKIKSWIRDQYEHPVESLHTLDEVLTWFKKNNIEFINSIPSCNLKDNSILTEGGGGGVGGVEGEGEKKKGGGCLAKLQ